ncbi:MAG TPA: potassium-transporting ATPase subunit KdpC [Polyangiales bacterium]|jgi:K+-transporting ATPase ATPase C chain|nr:potassium-transporting ATPase subunit KdpC [Polyangiales bacterium]
MLSQLRVATVLLALFTLITGVVYPVAMTALAQAVFPAQSNGSVVYRDQKLVGSALIGQRFESPQYFWGRPSATSPFAYNAGASSGSNLGPSHPALAAAVRERVHALRASDPTRASQPVPVDLVTASGSGLDPHISPAAALYQTARVSRARGLPEERVRALVYSCIEPRTLGFLGEPRVNVLRLNLLLDP